MNKGLDLEDANFFSVKTKQMLTKIEAELPSLILSGNELYSHIDSRRKLFPTRNTKSSSELHKCLILDR